MAQIITPELSGTVKPTGAGSIIRAAQWGIDATLDGYIIQDASITTSRMTDTTQDQRGATVSQLDYDEQQNLTLTVIGGDGTESGSLSGIVVGDIDFSFAGKKWKVESVTYRGNYQSKKMYDIACTRWTNFPTNA